MATGLSRILYIPEAHIAKASSPKGPTITPIQGTLTPDMCTKTLPFSDDMSVNVSYSIYAIHGRQSDVQIWGWFDGSFQRSNYVLRLA